MEELLGGARSLGRALASEADVAALGLEGVPFSAVLALSTAFALDRADMGDIARSPASHPSRPLGEDWNEEAQTDLVARLSPAESVELLASVRVLAHARAVFGSDTEAGSWLRTVQPVLGGRRPIAVMATETGRQAVDDVLTRIEHGVFA